MMNPSLLVGRVSLSSIRTFRMRTISKEGFEYFLSQKVTSSILEPASFINASLKFSPHKSSPRFITSITHPLNSQPKSSSTTLSKSKSSTYYRVNKISFDGRLSSDSLTVADIIRGSSVHARDLFSLALTSADEESIQKKDPNQPEYGKNRTKKIISRNPPPVILPRGEKIIISFGHIKAVIGNQEGMLFSAQRPSVRLLAEEISTNLQRSKEQLSSHDPIEILFMEMILDHVCSTWSRRILLFKPIVDALGNKSLDSEQDYSQTSGNILRLVPLKDSLQNFEMQVSQAWDCLTALLNDEEDMVQLLLTAQAAAAQQGKKVEVSQHESVELMIEEYSRQLQNLLQEINYLLRRVESKQDLLKMSLDTYRNQMLRANVYLSVGAVCLGTSATVAGIFGMNLLHGMESSENAFWFVTAGTAFFSGSVFLLCMNFLSATRINKVAVSQFTEIRTVTKALRDLDAVDYAAKHLIENEKDVGKKEFKDKINEARIDGHQLFQHEADFLFDILDSSKDGLLQKSEIFQVVSHGNNQKH